MEFVIITGMSGAGKSQAINVLEDINFYCMDNLPPMLLPNFFELCKASTKKVDKVAVVVDIRGGVFFNDLFTSLNVLSQNGIKYSILYLEASDEELVKRYKELRRPHPLSPTRRIIDGIKEERNFLKEVKQKSNYIIDTTGLKLAKLKEEIQGIFVKGKTTHNMTITVMSFGYKYGIPYDSDLVFDVRFLPNPYYIEELKQLTGNDKEVQDYVMKYEISKNFLEKLIDMLEFLLPNYIREGKSNIVIAIGCTGGRHRSITIANRIAKHFGNENYRISLTHRDEKNNV
ncbi:RNase adapter RapZ [Sedimentibacter sp. zth1]|uniref:RNase adapter RapZ n=1 Tax=Sedimentibacter sp. zth1 TaxID=2816908 RepID=UPI001A9346C5|nr:RNase adapter RapZ [Sedimentibacter sp. zth1]QSX05315.1 RNase adapter RapZ [Sedimentibacter sp. zth1]